MTVCIDVEDWSSSQQINLRHYHLFNDQQTNRCNGMYILDSKVINRSLETIACQSGTNITLFQIRICNFWTVVKRMAWIAT